FQAEDGIRDFHVTGVQRVLFRSADVEKELALGPVREILRQWHIDSILIVPVISQGAVIGSFSLDAIGRTRQFTSEEAELCQIFRSEERRVGKERRSGWAREHIVE